MKKLGSNLEEDFRAAETKRKQAEEKRQQAANGTFVHGSTEEALQKIGDFRQGLSLVMGESLAFDRITKVLDLAESSLETNNSLKMFSEELNGVAGSLSVVQGQLETVNKQLSKLSGDLMADLDERQTLRQKQSDTLDKLNKYLKDWR